MSDIKNQVDPNDTFYDVLDFLIELNGDWLTDRAKNALSHKEYFSEIRELNGADALSVAKKLIQLVDRKLQVDAFDHTGRNKSKWKKSFTGHIENLKKSMHEIYGRYEDGFSSRSPDHADDLFKHLLLLEEKINTPGTYEYNVLQAKRKPLISKDHFTKWADNINQVYGLKITPYNITRFWSDL